MDKHQTQTPISAPGFPFTQIGIDLRRRSSYNNHKPTVRLTDRKRRTKPFTLRKCTRVPWRDCPAARLCSAAVRSGRARGGSPRTRTICCTHGNTCSVTGTMNNAFVLLGDKERERTAHTNVEQRHTCELTLVQQREQACEHALRRVDMQGVPHYTRPRHQAHCQTKQQNT